MMVSDLILPTAILESFDHECKELLLSRCLLPKVSIINSRIASQERHSSPWESSLVRERDLLRRHLALGHSQDYQSPIRSGLSDTGLPPAEELPHLAEALRGDFACLTFPALHTFIFN